ncbi:MAG: hypothetical protein P4L31_00095 [Candidatus Babeliales bacterium]|nr:hypothetical protein [Candidatus Babeliales bacterium]
MKNNKKIITCAVLLALLSINNSIFCKNPKLSLEEATAAAAALAAAKAAAGTFYTGAGADVAANQFLGTLMWLKAQGPLAWAAVSPAAPYVIGGTAVLICTYGGYKIYRCYNPTPEQIARNEQFLAEAAKAHEAQSTLVEEQKVLAMEARKKQEALMAEAAFKKCLKNNPGSERNAMGVPSPCSSLIQAYAMAAGDREVDETVKTFNKYTVQGA